MILRALLLAVLALFAVAGCSGDGDDSSSASEEDLGERAAAASSDDDAAEADDVGAPLEGGSANGPEAELRQGTAEAEAGTVADPEGNPPDEPEPAADLRSVELTSNDDALYARFELDGPVEGVDRLLLWTLEIHVDGELAYSASAQLADDGLVAGVFDWEAVEQHPLPAPEIEGAELRLVVPLDLAPGARGEFEWAAEAVLDEAWSDRMPSEGLHVYGESG